MTGDRRQARADIDLWDLSTKQKVRTLSGLRGSYPVVVAVSPDKRLVAAGAAHAQSVFASGPADTRVLVWDATTGDEVASLPGGVKGHRCLAFAPDGRTVAAGGEDHSLYVWELATGTVRARFTGHEGPVTSLAFSPDSRTLYTGSSDTTVLAWDLLQPPEALNVAEAWADLAVPDATTAHRAMRTLLNDPENTLAKLKQQLTKAPPTDETALRKLVVDLSSPVFPVRQTASKELLHTGRVAIPFLQEAIENNASLELTRRANELIRLLRPHRLSGDSLQQVRAIELLEHLGTTEARRLMSELASGAPGDLRTEEAKASLQRMGHPKRRR